MQPRLLAASNNVLIKLNSFLFVWNNPDLLQISTLSNNRWIGQQATNGKKKKIWNKRKKFYSWQIQDYVLLESECWTISWKFRFKWEKSHQHRVERIGKSLFFQFLSLSMLSKGRIHFENLEITCGCHHQGSIHFQQKGGKILRHNNWCAGSRKNQKVQNLLGCELFSLVEIYEIWNSIRAYYMIIRESFNNFRFDVVQENVVCRGFQMAHKIAPSPQTKVYIHTQTLDV